MRDCDYKIRELSDCDYKLGDTVMIYSRIDKSSLVGKVRMIDIISRPYSTVYIVQYGQTYSDRVAATADNMVLIKREENDNTDHTDRNKSVLLNRFEKVLSELIDIIHTFKIEK